MRKAAAARRIVFRADVIPNLNGDRRRGVLLDREDLQAVGERAMAIGNRRDSERCGCSAEGDKQRGNDEPSSHAPIIQISIDRLCNTSANCGVDGSCQAPLLRGAAEISRHRSAGLIEEDVVMTHVDMSVATRPHELPAVLRLNILQRCGGHSLAEHPGDFAVAEDIGIGRRCDCCYRDERGSECKKRKSLR